MSVSPGDRVLVVQAHPDDAEFGCGGTVARFTQDGAEVYYLVCTDGNRGTYDPEMMPEKLAATRREEEVRAASMLGVREVVFLGYEDGELTPSLELRGRVVREVRRIRPNVVMAIDPWRRYEGHPDHRAAGFMAVEAAIFSSLPLYHPEHLGEGLAPHLPEKLYFYFTDNPDTWVDVGGTLERKIEAVCEHRSQMAMMGRAAKLSGKAGLEGKSDEEAGREMAKAMVREDAREQGRRAGLEYAEALKAVGVGPGFIRALREG